MPLSSRERKIAQRRDYHNAFAKVKHGHGGRWIRKKEVSALGGSGGSKGA